MQFFASCWERFPKQVATTALVGLVLGFNFISHLSLIAHMLPGTGWGWD